MKLLAVTLPGFFENESGLINQLFHQGLECLHLRKPDTDLKSLRKLLDSIDSNFYGRLAIHGPHQLAEEYCLKRLHFTEKHRLELGSDQLKELDAGGYILSTSVHRLEDLEGLDSAFHYTFFSPVFDSISKKDYKSVLPQNFRLPQRSTSTEVIALGGINHQNIRQVKKMNFDGAAVLGHLWNKADAVLDEFKSLQQAVIAAQETAL